MLPYRGLENNELIIDRDRGDTSNEEWAPEMYTIITKLNYNNAKEKLGWIKSKWLINRWFGWKCC